MPTTAENALKKATKGLVYMSETDEPLHTFTWKDAGGPLTGEKLLELIKADPGTKVEEVPLADFFSTQTEGDEEGVEKYKDLQETLREHLSGVTAFRVGEVNVRYYVVGMTKQGDCAGVWTKAVET